jgi:hypothetical protein
MPDIKSQEITAELKRTAAQYGQFADAVIAARALAGHCTCSGGSALAGPGGDCSCPSGAVADIKTTGTGSTTTA